MSLKLTDQFIHRVFPSFTAVLIGIALFTTVSLAVEPEAPVPSVAEQGLQIIVARQQELLATAAKNGEDFDEDSFRQAAQQLTNEYEDFLKKNTEYAPAHAAYGVFLGKIGMRKQSAVILLKANTLFGRAAQQGGASTPAFVRTWALVKNQLGNYLAEEGKPLEAVNYYLAAIDLTPAEPLYHYQLGSLLTEAQSDFLKDGNWTRASLEKAMHHAFRRAAELAPERIEFTYRYAESFYDLELPDWPVALKVWGELEEKAPTDVERQTMRLHAANILLKQHKLDHARALLATVTEAALQAQKQKLVAQLTVEPTK